MSDIDGGVIRRLKITEFVSRFVEQFNAQDVEDKYMYEFKIDKELKNKLETYKTVFMCILLDYYRIYREEGIIPPDSVLKVTKKYENNNNNIKAFIDENIVKGKKTDFITKDELKNLYKADRLLQTSFNKFTIFLNQIENALCIEFKLDTKKKIQKLEGYHIRRPEMDDSETEDDDDL
jgi:phage/plasmid-associated DNA primase